MYLPTVVLTKIWFRWFQMMLPIKYVTCITSWCSPLNMLSGEMRLSTTSWEKHSKDPCMGGCSVAKFIWVEIEADPWVSNFTSPSVLPWNKLNLVLSKAKIKTSVQNFSFMLKLSLFGAHADAMGPGSYQTHIVVCSLARDNVPMQGVTVLLGRVWGQRETERERGIWSVFIPLRLY